MRERHDQRGIQSNGVDGLLHLAVELAFDHHLNEPEAEAGPRVAIFPQGIFRNSKGEQVALDPFTIPIGGNALAVLNLEARVPLPTPAAWAIKSELDAKAFVLKRGNPKQKATEVAPNHDTRSDGVAAAG